MKKLMILVIIGLICFSQAKVVTSSERIGKTQCYVRVNPIKGLIDNGPCEVTEIVFYDADGMWLGTYDIRLDAYHSYKGVWFSSISYIEDTHSIIATFNKSADEDYAESEPSKLPQEVIFQPYGSPYPDGGKLPRHCWGNPKGKYWCSWEGGIPSR